MTRTRRSKQVIFDSTMATLLLYFAQTQADRQAGSQASAKGKSNWRSRQAKDAILNVKWVNNVIGCFSSHFACNWFAPVAMTSPNGHTLSQRCCGLLPSPSFWRIELAVTHSWQCLPAHLRVCLSLLHKWTQLLVNFDVAHPLVMAHLV